MKKRLKKGLALLMALSLALSWSAAAAGTLEISSVSGKQGDTVTVSVHLTSTDVCGGGFTVSYNDAELELVSAEKSGGWIGFVNPSDTAPTVRVSFSSTQVIADQELCLLHFRVLADTPVDGSPITVTNARFYDIDSQPTTAGVISGSVSRDCVWLHLASAETVEGQAARVEVSLSGKLLPAGGNFTITYDPAVVRPTAVLPLECAGDAMLSYDLSVSGQVKVSFAGAAGVENGRLCAVVFAAVGSADTGTVLSVTDPRFYDADSQLLDHAVTTGNVSVVVPTEADPKLWVVGGAITEDGTATVSILAQGRGRVCGGQFSLLFDSAMLAQVTPGADVTVREDAGKVHVSWAGIAADLDERTLLTIRFAAPVEGSAITFDGNVRLYDGGSKLIEVVDIRPAAITARSSVTAVVDEVKVDTSGSTSEVQVAVDLADVKYFTDTAVETVTAILALYNNGQLTGFDMVEDITLSSGIAETALAAQTRKAFDAFQVFLLSADGSAVPLCQALGDSVN